MQEFDVIVIGAGPAGGQCARDLSLAGKKTLLIEKAKDFSVNNYSSGGAPLSILKDFNLPESVIGSYWNKLAFLTSHENQLWENSQPLGIVLDFKQLRQFLADEMLKHGGELKLGHLYKSHEKDHDRTIVHVKNQDTQQLDSFTTRVLVDATGVERRVLLKHKKDKTHAALEAPGIEYLVSVDPSIYQKYANTLSFFWGQRWMPQGYAWIFPMQANQLKIGVIRYFSHDRYVPHEESYQFYLEKFMRECLQIDETSILDRHGKTILYTYHQADPKYEENVIAVGDAISTVNPLAFEGIRHAMFSGQVAARCINDYLDGKVSSFREYPKGIQNYCGLKWRLSEFVMNRIYKEKEDDKLDCMLRAFKKFSFQDVLDFSFGYQPRQVLRFYFNYLPLLVKRKLKKLFSR